jgi:uncharacterized protein HemX
VIRLYILAAIVLAFLGLGAYAYVMKLERDVAVADKKAVVVQLEKAVDVNKQNNKAIAQLENAAKEAQANTEKEIAASQQREAASNEVIKDMRNVPGANDPAGPYWDAYSERLRGTQRNH